MPLLLFVTLSNPIYLCNQIVPTHPTYIYLSNINLVLYVPTYLVCICYDTYLPTYLPTYLITFFFFLGPRLGYHDEFEVNSLE